MRQLSDKELTLFCTSQFVVFFSGALSIVCFALALALATELVVHAQTDKASSLLYWLGQTGQLAC